MRRGEKLAAKLQRICSAFIREFSRRSSLSRTLFLSRRDISFLRTERVRSAQINAAREKTHKSKDFARRSAPASTSITINDVESGTISALFISRFAFAFPASVSRCEIQLPVIQQNVSDSKLFDRFRCHR